MHLTRFASVTFLTVFLSSPLALQVLPDWDIDSTLAAPRTAFVVMPLLQRTLQQEVTARRAAAKKAAKKAAASSPTALFAPRTVKL